MSSALRLVFKPLLVVFFGLMFVLGLNLGSFDLAQTRGLGARSNLAYLQTRLSAVALADRPSDAMPEIKALGDQVLGIAKDSACKADRAGCRKRLTALLEQYWDTSEMARSALGYHWKSLSEDQREQFTKLFASLVESIYLSRSNFSKAQNYTNSVNIRYLREIPEGDGYAQIATDVTLKAGDRPIEVNYRLRFADGKWKVYDVIVEDISLTGNYRNQFNRVINSQGYPALVRILQDKLQQIRASQGT